MKQQHERQWNQFQLSVNSQTLSCKNAKAAEFFPAFSHWRRDPSQARCFFCKAGLDECFRSKLQLLQSIATQVPACSSGSGATTWALSTRARRSDLCSPKYLHQYPPINLPRSRVNSKKVFFSDTINIFIKLKFNSYRNQCVNTRR